MTKGMAKLVKTRFKNDELAIQRIFSRMIKTMRIIQNRTLEEVAAGICSVSYLSKIENCSVFVDPFYYKALFEKLDIKYDDVMLSRAQSVITKMFIAYYEFDLNQIKAYAEEMISAPNYFDIERELVVYLYNILTNNFDQTLIGLQKMDEIKSTFTDEELIAYIFILCLYFHKTNNNKEAYDYISLLTNIKVVDDNMKIIINDLAAGVCYGCGYYIQAYRYSNEVVSNIKAIYSPDRVLINRLRKISLESKELKDEHLQQLDSMKLDRYASEACEEFFYLHAVTLMNKGMPEEAFKILSSSKLGSKNMALMSIVSCQVKEKKTLHLFMEIAETYSFQRHEFLYSNLMKYVLMKHKKANPHELFEFIKDVLFPKIEVFHEQIVVDFIRKEFYDAGFRAGKYKETLRYKGARLSES